MQEAAVSDNPESPSFEGSRFYMGYGEARGGAFIAPGLTAHVAAEMGKEAAILKEKKEGKRIVARKRKRERPWQARCSGRGRGWLSHLGGPDTPLPVFLFLLSGPGLTVSRLLVMWQVMPIALVQLSPRLIPFLVIVF